MRVALASTVLLGSLVAASLAPLGADAREPEAGAPVRTEAVEYRDGDVVLEGFLARPASDAKAPGVVVVHEWWGLAPHAKRKAEDLARAGYVAFALDMYGKGKITTDRQQAGQWAGEFRGPANRENARRRAAAGLAVLTKHPQVDAQHLAAIGFCFGGTIALEMAWSGADLDAAVSFHGSPTVPTPEEAKAVKATILVCNGADDAAVSAETLRAFEDAMKAADLDWMLVQYGNAVHAFTNPDAGKAGMGNVAYEERADRRSWAHMRSLFSERFGR
jgi:dienelactone hydrolase